MFWLSRLSAAMPALPQHLWFLKCCSSPLKVILTSDHRSSPDSQLLHAVPPAIALFQGQPLLQPDQAVELVEAGQQLELVLIQLTLVQELPVHRQQGTCRSVHAYTGGLVQVRQQAPRELQCRA